MAVGSYRYEDAGEGVVHWMQDGRIWISRGYSLFRGTEKGRAFEAVGSIPVKAELASLSGIRLADRFVRGGVLSMVPLEDGTLVATVRGTVFVRRPDSQEFVATLHRPHRTWRLEALPDGTLFAGEYFSNGKRGQVEILVSRDRGSSWQQAHLFPAGAIRHVHSITYDEFRDELIVLTGDENSESMIMASGDRFRTTRVIRGGSQAARAVGIVPWREGYWVGTDTPFEQNYAQYIALNGRIIARVPLAGSCLAVSAAAGQVLFGTAAEPSSVNLDPTAKLYAYDGSSWTVLGSWRADRWSGTGRRAALFQMARVLLPRCSGAVSSIYATTVAVQGADGRLHRWDVEPPALPGEASDGMTGGGR